MIAFDNTYVALPAPFFEEIAPSSAVRPELLAFNGPLADSLGLSWEGADDARLAELFSGLTLPEGARPIALAYAGHQFGHFVPQLGDGRAVLLGEVVDAAGRRFDVQLKGAGRTRFSRGGDGRSSLGPVIREYIVSEAMHALGVPTTRALAAVATGDTVFREEALPGAVMTRVASSHIRVGTFEYFAYRKQEGHLRALADYAIARHYPELADDEAPYLALFRAVARRKLDLVARWMSVGFIHGVMNTDNTSIAGETIDYGPCAFMDAYRADKVFSSIDQWGRYRYENQGRVAMWNLSVLASCLAPLVSPDAKVAAEALNAEFEALDALFDQAWVDALAPKLGLFEPRASDHDLVREWLAHMEANALDFTNAFRGLAEAVDADAPFHASWRERLADQPQTRDEAVALMNAHNAAYIPRNHQVERAIRGALAGDLTHFERMNEVLADPYIEQPGAEDLARAPEQYEVVERTFCGT